MFIGQTTHEYGTMSGDVETCTYTYFTHQGDLWVKEDWHDYLVKPETYWCDGRTICRVAQSYELDSEQILELSEVLAKAIKDEMRATLDTLEGILDEWHCQPGHPLRQRIMWMFV